jgi:spermidine synthase
MTEPEDKSILAGLRPLGSKLSKLFDRKGPKVLFEDDSEHHHVTVTEHGGRRTMFLGPEAGEAETSISVSDPGYPVFEYPGMFLVGLSLAVNRRILMLGLGGGFIPTLFQNHLPDHEMTVVEVDPLIADLAGRYFGFRPGGNVTLAIADGRGYIEAAPDGAFDQIWLDAFDGSYIPKHLIGDDFLLLCRRKMVDGGLLIQNLHQNMYRIYNRQLFQTKEVFGVDPLLLGGIRSANTVAMSLNSDSGSLPSDTEGLVAAVKAFRLKVGPYDLGAECLKLIFDPRLF